MSKHTDYYVRKAEAWGSAGSAFTVAMVLIAASVVVGGFSGDSAKIVEAALAITGMVALLVGVYRSGRAWAIRPDAEGR